MADVAREQQSASLTRTMRAGDELSLDNGRVVVKVLGVRDRRVVLNYHIDRDLKVDKPPKPGG